jgi:hypothetical protein
LRYYVKVSKMSKKLEKPVRREEGLQGKSPGMSLAFVLIVMLIGGALTAAALWIVENATRTTRMAKEKSVLYAISQEGLQRGLKALDQTIGGLGISEDMLGRGVILLEKPSGKGDDWWQEGLEVLAENFIPSGAREIVMDISKAKGRWQVFALGYEVDPGVAYVSGLPPKIEANLFKKKEEILKNVTAGSSYAAGSPLDPDITETSTGVYMILSTVEIETLKGPVRGTAFGLIRTRPWKSE